MTNSTQTTQSFHQACIAWESAREANDGSVRVDEINAFTVIEGDRILVDENTVATVTHVIRDGRTGREGRYLVTAEDGGGNVHRLDFAGLDSVSLVSDLANV